MANRTAARLAPRTRRHHDVPASVREALRTPGERLDRTTREAMENFAEVLAVLQESARSHEAILATLDLTTIIDAEACA